MRAPILALTAWMLMATASVAQMAYPSPEEVLTRSANADKYFRVQPDGAVLHNPSGLSCPANLPDVYLVELKLYAADGTDVSCQYVRFDFEASQVHLFLTLYIYRYPDNTVETNFVNAQKEIQILYPDATYSGEAIEMSDEDTPRWEGLRSAKYDLVISGRPYLSHLAVVEKQGWTIKVRMSTAKDVLTPDGMALHIKDQGLPAIVLSRVISTQGASAN